jgi:GST-like protein
MPAPHRIFQMTDPTSAEANQPPGYVPPKVWVWSKPNGGRFAGINRPISGATHEKALPVGQHALQLYSLGTPNGQKITILLEELLAMGHTGAEYDAWMIRIHEGEQFSSGFVEINPNSKIPAMVDHSSDPPTRLFESGSILFYLGEKFGAFLPTEHHPRAATLNWLFWQVGAAPFVAGGFGHFYAYAPFKIEYAIDRYAMETKRQLHLLDTHLASHTYMIGDEYTIADIAIWPWYGGLLRTAYNAQEFLATHEYRHVQRWTELVGSRPAVQRGLRVNRTGAPDRLAERHDAADFDRACAP